VLNAGLGPIGENPLIPIGLWRPEPLGVFGADERSKLLHRNVIAI